MERRFVPLHPDGLGVIAYGDFGRPLLAFPSEQGYSHDYESMGMVDAIADLIESGRVKLYCVDAVDGQTWHDKSIPLEERARRHGAYEEWIMGPVASFIREDCAGVAEIAVTGPSFGAYHAANFALKRADLFPLAICHSGIYDVSAVGWGDSGEAVYFNNPAHYVRHLHGDHLDFLRSRVTLVLVCGQGQWEDTTGALESTKQFAGLLAEKGLRHELDLWGYDVPHDWPSWCAQLAHHLPRFC